jgi:hypothetical protein
VSAGYTNPLLLWGSGPGAMQFIDNISIGVRVYGGWNYQVAPAWVVGVEGDFAYANESAVFHGSPYPANLLFGSPNLPFGATIKLSKNALSLLKSRGFLPLITVWLEDRMARYLRAFSAVKYRACGLCGE